MQSRKIPIPNQISCAHPGGTNFRVCNNECMTNYPIQQCGSVCGAITVIMTAIFVQAPSYWQHVIQSAGRMLSCWIRNPTGNSSYLRKVLISWLMLQRVDMSNLGIQDEQHQSNSELGRKVLIAKRRDEEISKCEERTR